jgi:WD40 repeat protein
VWDSHTGELLNIITGHTLTVTSLTITSDNSKIVSGSHDKTIKVWDFSGKCYSTNNFDTVISSIALSKNNNLIALGDQDGNLPTNLLSKGVLMHDR